MKRILILLWLTCFTANAGTNALYSDAQSWTGGVYIAIIGDSISGGGGGSGAGISALPNAISTASGGKLTATNFSIGGSVWTNEPWMGQTADQTMYSQITNALPLRPRWLFVQLGRNDIWPFMNTSSNLTEGYPAYWPHIQTSLRDCYTNCAANGTRLLIGEVLPICITNCCTAAQMEEGGIPTVTNYNLGYKYFTTTNAGSYISIQHDAFGVWNTNTPGYNLLNSNYWLSSADQLHINQAAYTMWGQLLVSNLANFFADPPRVNIGTARFY